MDFINFALSYGLQIKNIRDDGRWYRCPTLDKPRSNNGAYKFCGDHGFIQNHATMDKVELWKSDKPIDLKSFTARNKAVKQDIQNEALAAANKAAWMLSKSLPDKHDYFYLKGFPDHICMTMERDGKKLALLPMRVDNKLTSLQIIGRDGDNWKKTFLKGGVTKGATYIIGKGLPILCEGFATGLSVHKALKLARLERQIVICYSANNMIHVAKQLKPDLVIADNDKSGTGEKVAKEIGVKYWISKTLGNDFNDDHLERGDFAMMLELKQLLIKKPVR